MKARVSPRKVALLSALYFAQGLPFGFQANALPQVLRQAGVSLTNIGFAGALALPWALKALWSPWVDRHGSRSFGMRKSWIVPMQALLIVTCGAAAFVPASQSPGLLLALIFLMNLFAATQDIAVDGMAVDLLEPHELGAGNAAQVVGYKMGMLTGGGLLVYLSTWVGWSGLFGLMAALASVGLLIVVNHREAVPSHRESSSPTLKEIVSRMKQAFSTKRAYWALGLITTYKLGESMADRMFGPFLLDKGFRFEDVGLWLGTYGMVASLSGSFLAGQWVARSSPLSTVAWAGAFRVLPLAAQWAMVSGMFEPTAAAVQWLTCAEHFFGGMLTTTIFAFMMSQVDRRIGATHFTVLASLEVIGRSPGIVLSGWFADHFGYASVFGAAATASALFLLWLVPLKAARTSATV